MDVVYPGTAEPSHASQLVKRLTGLRSDGVTPALRESAKLALLDGLGCALFGAQFTWSRIAADLALESGEGAVTVLGRGQGAAPALAALANGTAIHSFELDDVILGSLTHAGAAVIPAALAAAEISNASGEHLLAGIVAGYELDARLGAALGQAPIAQGFHTTSVAGPLAGALAACIVAGASEEITVSALGIAASMSSGLKAFQQGTGGMVKRLHGGLGASNGVQAWQLASRGFEGPTQVIDGKFGLLPVFAGSQAQDELLTEGYGETWAIQRNWIKMYPCCALIHTVAQALEGLRRDMSLTASDVLRVRIGTSSRCLIQNSDTSPQESMAAQYSIPFNAALALTGDVRDPGAFLAPNLHDPVLRQMIGSIELYEDKEVDAAYPGRFGAKVQLETKDGRLAERTLWYAHGTPPDPCTPEEICAKFRKLASARIPMATAEAIQYAVHDMSSNSSLHSLFDALRVNSI